jgi:hypothetical protein
VHASPGEPGEVGEQPFEQPVSQRSRVDDGSIERLEDLRLEPNLLVKADPKVGEDEAFGPRLRVFRGQGPMVVRERGPEVSLAVGRVTGAQGAAEAIEGLPLAGPGGAQHREKARELPTDLLEHLEVPAGHRVAGPGERRGRRGDLADGAREAVTVGSVIDRPEECAELRAGMRDRLGPAEVVLDPAREILLPDGLPRLLRRPRRERAPVGAGSPAGRQGPRHLAIRLRDAEVPHDRVRDRADRLDLRDPGDGVGPPELRHGAGSSPVPAGAAGTRVSWRLVPSRARGVLRPPSGHPEGGA